MDGDRLILDFALVMVLLLVAPMLSLRLRLPDIAGIILAGVLVGEHGLGLFHLDQTFQLLGKVGLLYLMLLAGLEINLNEFVRYRKPSLVFGLLTFLIPQVLGALGARWLLGFTWPQSILLASMFASHTLIPFPIIQRFGLGRNRAVTSTIGGTILTDTAALLVLAVIVKSGGGGVGAAFWSRLGLSLAALVAGSIFLLPRLGYWFFRRAAPDGAAEFIFVLAMTFLVAYASELAGVEPIIGAFLAGLAFSPVVPGRGVLMSRLHFVGYALFIPFFLLSVGMRVNVRSLLAGTDGWMVALYMTAAVTGCKWAAARLSGRLLGYHRNETGVVFGLSVNQAAATLAAVLVGVRVGIFDDAVLNGTILMILVTCLLGPWLTERCARRLAEKEELRPAAPRHENGRILLPLVSPRHADAITDLALMLRSDRCTEPVYPLHVASAGPDQPERVAEAERLLGGAVARAEAAGIHAIPLARLDASIAGGILNAAVEFRTCAIVMGWHPRRYVASLLQSIPDRVIAHSTQAVLVYRSGRPLSTSRRLWVLAPPLIEHHAGLPNALQLAHRVASHAGMRVLLATTDQSRKAIRGLPVKHPPPVPASIPSMPTWNDVLAQFTRARTEEDAILLLSVRRGHLAWQPKLERLPAEWARQWPDANLMILFPPLLSGEENLAEEEDAPPAPAPNHEASRGSGTADCLPPRIPVEVSTPEPAEAMREILRRLLPDAGPTVVDALAQDLARETAVPLSPDIALLHLHTPLVQDARIGVGRHGAGFILEGFTARPQELALLLSPRSGTPDDHLRVLAALARAAHRGSLVPAG